MLRILFLFLCIVGSLAGLQGKEIKYPVSEIPEKLKENADAVIRMEKTLFEIHSKSDATEIMTCAITILNKSALPLANLGVYYDQEKKENVDIRWAKIFDAYGVLVRKLKNSEIHDVAASGGSFLASSRVKGASLSVKNLPFTLEYSYVKKKKGLFNIPDWYTCLSEGVAVQQSEFVVSVPTGMDIRYKLQNFDQEPSVVNDPQNGKKVYRWSVSDLVALQEEPMSPPMSELVPAVVMAPREFMLGSYTGRMDSWKNFGEFFYRLNKDRDELPKDLIEKVNEMIGDAPSKREKVDVLYKYLQDNTRYVSIQLGIGGYQAFEAEKVYKNGYGDCKALSNYMKGMLNVAGIPSHLAVISGGDEPPIVDLDFPNNSFNHMVLCVPLESDTVWLECTSNHGQPGYVANFIGDRYAVLATPEGGKLVRTPARTSGENLQVTRADAHLHANGHADVNVKIQDSGYEQDWLSYVIHSYSDADKEKWLRKRIDVGSFDLKSYSMGVDEAASMPTCTTSYELNINNCGSVSGSRIFLMPNLLNRRTSVPPKDDDRQYPVRVNYAYMNLDTVVYHMPEGYIMESMPEMPIEITSPFGAYRANMEAKGDGTFIYTRMLVKQKMELPPESYTDFREFIRKIVKADKMQVVLSGKS